MAEQTRTVAEVTVIDTLPERVRAGWRLIYAPGAGSNVHDPFGTYLCRKLADAGVPASRFHFPYQEAGSRRPDRPQVLAATWRAVIDATREPGVAIVIGGRSMGLRIASIIASEGVASESSIVDALALFAYPLHQPSHPERSRTEHLPTIAAPTLFCSGTRDTFGEPEELRAAARLVPASRLHLMEGADHGFAVLKRSGRSREEVYAEAVEALTGWVGARFDA